MAIKLTFLGTGTSSGVPMIGCNCEVCNSSDAKNNRLRTSALIQIDSKNYVIDSGPDFRAQMLQNKVTELHGIVYTHEHKDHIAGLDDVRAYNYFMNEPMNLYATEQVQIALKREFHYIFSNPNYPGVPKIETHLINNQTFTPNGSAFGWTPIQVLHADLPVFGYRIHNLAYITDANFISDDEKQKLKNLDVLIINALRHEPHYSHFTLHEALQLVNELKPQKAYFTHISHQLGLHELIQTELPKNVYLAYDGLTIESN